MTIFVLRSYLDGRQITLRSKGVAVTYAIRPEGEGSRLHARVLFAGPRLLAQALALGTC